MGGRDYTCCYWIFLTFYLVFPFIMVSASFFLEEKKVIKVRQEKDLACVITAYGDKHQTYHSGYTIPSSNKRIKNILFIWLQIIVTG